MSGLEWITDRESLFSIYQALVLYKIDYGSQFYNSASDHLKRVKVLQIECLRICSEAFKSSSVDSLQVETTTLPSPSKVQEGYNFLKILIQIGKQPSVFNI